MASSSGEVQRKIAALKARKTASEPDPRGFDYDPDEPLRFKRSGREKIRLRVLAPRWSSPTMTATSVLPVTNGFLHLLQRAPFSGVAV
jgi:hypothetical protein